MVLHDEHDDDCKYGWIFGYILIGIDYQKNNTLGNYFLPSHVDLLKKEIDGYLKLSEHFRDYMAFTSVYREVQQELFNNNEANEIREKKFFGMPLFLFRVIVSLIKERDLATRILVQKLNVVNHLIPTQWNTRAMELKTFIVKI